ncbi:MAG: hypothetical protein HOK67_29835 [Deltaproteobacteria bacterium]|jgi:hypothetical protein|nr:hypothetical protein [Deltaproteobacteria bacterium]MBT4637208.1 hypothetical protein [Deltaproteobacteria bacterium]MBT6504097.1 hypothetical protein [Deltaproteobacteria bacterium]MBT6616500.1 hypothetical protein [Deltaproteobacteria bacterium]MBT7714315.1 hypothetical protein [Deltaproteobacteria bacterium]
MNTFKKLRVTEIGGGIITLVCLLLVFISGQTINLGIMALLIVLAGLFLTMFLMTIKTENEVLEKNYWYEQIIDHWENPLSITDMDMNWTFINKTVEGLIGQKRSEILGQQCSNWGANICNTEDCGVTCLRRGRSKTFFYQWETDFRVDTHYLLDRQGEKTGHLEIVTNIAAQKSLNQLSKNVRKTAANVASGSQELTNSAQTLSAGATEQAASIEEISSSLNEVGAQTKLNSENADQAKNLSEETKETVQKGNRQMEVMVESMKTISETSSSVSKVIKVIDEIAFQTNLLALNAAVEAARAGKYGKGFAVVAEEVRALAGRSAAAAKDTTELIEQSIKGVETGVRNADETANILTEVNASMEKMNDLVSEIASSSLEQNSSIEEVNVGLSQVNTVVQQNASISEENASASEELKAQVNQLLRMTEGIEITEDIGEDKSVQAEPAVVQPPSLKPAQQIGSSQSGTTNSKRLITLDDDDFGKY